MGLVLKRRISDNYKWYYYPVSNSRGDIVEIHDGGGRISAKYNYDAWGKLLSITDANGTPLEEDSFAHQISVRYRGYVYDQETGLYYLQSRYYDPETGRFINADDVDYIGYSDEDISHNLFAYCENEPVIHEDSSGFLIKEINMIINSIRPIIAKLKNAIKIDRDDRSCATHKKKDATKGTIRIDFTKLNSEMLAEHIDVMGIMIADELTDIAFSAFEEEFNRPFLLSKRCVSNEIYQHMAGYLWSIGKIHTIPVAFCAYYIKNGVKDIRTIKSQMKNACKVADIYELDVIHNKTEASWYGFNYYDGIADCYKGTKKDPYFNTETKKRNRNFIRNGWQYEKI